MSEYPNIKAYEVRIGDTIRTSTSISGVKTTRELQVSSIYDSGRTLAFETKELGETLVLRVDDVELVDRPAPKLPTTPGSLVWITKWSGGTLPQPVFAMRDDSDTWRAATKLPDATRWLTPDEILEWSEVTVAKATP